MKLTSPDFKHNEFLPSKFTCDGQGILPKLIIEDIPSNTKSLALIYDDPDAPRGTFTHWLVWNIPPTTKEIEENQFIQGLNDFKKTSYGPPCPPSGIHRYIFKLFALDIILNLQQGSTKQQLESAMQNHIIDKTELIGKYQRH